jgi:hypothetical protein
LFLRIYSTLSFVFMLSLSWNLVTSPEWHTGVQYAVQHYVRYTVPGDKRSLTYYYAPCSATLCAVHCSRWQAQPNILLCRMQCNVMCNTLFQVTSAAWDITVQYAVQHYVQYTVPGDKCAPCSATLCAIHCSRWQVQPDILLCSMQCNIMCNTLFQVTSAAWHITMQHAVQHYVQYTVPGDKCSLTYYCAVCSATLCAIHCSRWQVQTGSLLSSMQCNSMWDTLFLHVPIFMILLTLVMVFLSYGMIIVIITCGLLQLGYLSSAS